MNPSQKVFNNNQKVEDSRKEHSDPTSSVENGLLKFMALILPIGVPGAG